MPPLLLLLLLPLSIAFLLLLHPWRLAPSLALPTGPHINNLNVLLPPRLTHPVRYRLQGSGGCFSWTWDHHDILSVLPEYDEKEDCSSGAVITSIAPYSGRRATAVYATDALTGQVLRCEVFVDKISRVQIFHHSVKLDLDGLATLRIRAFDSEDNVFSSLVGIRFEWALLPVRLVGERESRSLAHVRLKDTPLSDCGCICGDIDTQIELEQTEGVGSDLFVVRGVSVGQERVLVKVLEPQLENLGDEILLTVAEAMLIEPPSPLFILTGTRVQYTLKTLRNNMPSLIKLPSPHHRWSSANSSVASVDPYNGAVLGQMIGSTSVVVEDLRVAEHQQMSSLHVVLPISLRWHLSPLYSHSATHRPVMRRVTTVHSSDAPWHLVVGREYVVQLLAFSEESGSLPIYLTKDNNLQLSFGDWPYWNTVTIPEDVALEQGWHNATLLKAISEGSGRIVATLKYSNIAPYTNSSTDIAPQQILSAEQKVTICSRVYITFENNEGIGRLILPWSGQNYQLAARGGCGQKVTDYQWTTSDQKVATISSVGVVQSKGLGKAFIRVTVAIDPLNFDEITVEVSIPSSIAMVGGLPVEFEVGSHFSIAVTLKSPEGFPYTKCDIFDSVVQWGIHGAGGVFVQINDTQVAALFASSLQDGSASGTATCGWGYFMASQPGRATVTASLSFDNLLKVAPGITDVIPAMEVSWIISSYIPLKIEQASDGRYYGGYDLDISHLQPAVLDFQRGYQGLKELLLVPGSSMTVMIQGGPDRWSQMVDFIEEYDVNGMIEGKAIEEVSVAHLSSSGGRFYNIMCTSIGNYSLTFYRGNSIGEDHPKPAIAKVSLSLTCSIPSMITLLVDKPGNSLVWIKASSQSEHDARRVHTSLATVVNARTIRVAAVALDSTAKPFANASSLFLNWSLIDCQGLAHWDQVARNEANHADGLWDANLELGDKTGWCIVKASVIFLINNKLLAPSVYAIAHDILRERELFLSDAIQLQLVENLRIEPESILLYFHLDAKANLVILGGTGNLEFHINDSKVATAIQQPVSSHVVHLTVAARGMGTAMLTVQDIGLATPVSTSAVVCVADVAWVRMLLPDESSIPLHSTLTVNLIAGDSMGNVFEDSQFEFMNVWVHLQDEILELSNESGLKLSGSRILGSRFILRGSSVGVTNNLYVSVLPNSGREILSELGRVEVYAPLSIHPSELALAPGAEYVVWVHGGPSTGITILFLSSNETVASIDGVAGLLVANDVGNSRVISQAYSQSGGLVCQASLEVRVSIPRSMLLNVRGGHLGIQQEMSVFPVGTDVDLFAFFELCMDYKWVVGDEQVLSLQPLDDLMVDSFSGICADDRREADCETWMGLSKSKIHERDSAIDARFSARVVGRASGRTDVTVSFTCHFQSNSRGIASYPVFYKASDAIWVLPDPPLALGIPTTWLLPPNVLSSTVLPQPTDSSLEAASPVTKRHITYSMMHGGSGEIGGIRLDGGRIKTSERNDLACIQATDHRTGRSEIAVCIRVADVAQMTIGEKCFPFHTYELSVGTHHLFNVVLRDRLGTPFYDVGSASQLVVATNRADVVYVKVSNVDGQSHSRNASISVQTLRQGVALIKISEKGIPLVSDYVLVVVGAFISPKNSIFHIGGRVNFSIVGKGILLNEYGQWSSSNEDVMKVVQDTGEAFAVGAGKTVIHFNGSRLVTHTPATVIRVAAISIKSPSEILTNVPYPDKGYLFPVRFRDSEGHDVGSIGTGKELSYNCRVVPSYIGHCAPWQEHGRDMFYCVFFPYSPERLFWTLQRQVEAPVSSLNVGDAKGFLSISVIAEVLGTADMGTVDASFVGGFSVLDVKDELHISPSANRSLLTVVGSAGGVEVSWLRKDSMNVKRISSENDAFGVGGHAVYEVTVFHEERPFADKLVFSLPSTGQQVQINVKYDAGQPETAPLFGQIVTAVVMTIVVIIVPLIICARLLDLPRPLRAQREPQMTSMMSDVGNEILPDGSPSRTISALDAVQTPPRLSSSRSPPQPYTDYVSRTIEKTPYFRGERFQRFDPLRTY